MLHNEWYQQLYALQQFGAPVGPRGQATHELIDRQFKIDDASFCLLDVPERKLNFRFAVAEWVWMMTGHSDVKSIAQYNSIISQFSDDGVFFSGAYGPHIVAQRYRVIQKLRRDPATRQAVIDIPRPRRDTKDEPCTLSFQFLLRENEPDVLSLNLIVTMRSSDVWLGIPYDVFNFAQLLNAFAGELNVPRGWLSLRLGSSHLYERNLEDAQRVLHGDVGSTIGLPALPGFPPFWLEQVLVHRDGGFLFDAEVRKEPHVEAWKPYAQVLLARTSAEARDVLLEASIPVSEGRR